MPNNPLQVDLLNLRGKSFGEDTEGIKRKFFSVICFIFYWKAIHTEKKRNSEKALPCARSFRKCSQQLSQSEGRNQESPLGHPCRCTVLSSWAILSCFSQATLGSQMGSESVETWTIYHVGNRQMLGEDLANGLSCWDQNQILIVTFSLWPVFCLHIQYPVSGFWSQNFST